MSTRSSNDMWFERKYRRLWIIGTTAAVAIAASGWFRDPLLLVAGTIGVAFVGLRVSKRIKSQRVDEQTNLNPEPCDANEAEDLSAESPVGVAGKMIDRGRYALLLRSQIAATLDESVLGRAAMALHESMALVPQGYVHLAAAVEHEFDTAEQPHAETPSPAVKNNVWVDAVFLDRCPVTNQQYDRFVAARGYEQMDLWNPDIWTAVLGFLDETGHPGPRFWHEGRPSHDKLDHPVVGICWYEAAAYARWIGKRLPSDAEWSKAGSWPVAVDGDRLAQQTYPWGNSMDVRRANLYSSGHGDTVSIDRYADGVSVGGVYQLIGNAWEWATSDFHGKGAAIPLEWVTTAFNTDRSLKSIRGGAYDTYFDVQATCHFASGEQPLARRHNISFRCALAVCDVFGVLKRQMDGEANPNHRIQNDESTEGDLQHQAVLGCETPVTIDEVDSDSMNPQSAIRNPQSAS